MKGEPCCMSVVLLRPFTRQTKPTALRHYGECLASTNSISASKHHGTGHKPDGICRSLFQGPRSCQDRIGVPGAAPLGLPKIFASSPTSAAATLRAHESSKTCHILPVTAPVLPELHRPPQPACKEFPLMLAHAKEGPCLTPTCLHASS